MNPANLLQDVAGAGEVLILLAIGICVALPATMVLTRYVWAQLYGIQPTDPVAIALATLTGYLPARRATRVDPIRALRYE